MPSPQRSVLSAAFAALAAVALVGPSLVAQDFLLYKFDGSCSSEVVNHARGSLGNGTLLAGPGFGYDSGRLGDGLAAGTVGFGGVRNVVDTGWDPSVQPWTGDATVAFWARQGTPPSSTSYFLGSGSSGWRMYTSGQAGGGITFASFGGVLVADDLKLEASVFDFAAAAANDWVHVALTIDDTARVATWYIDGLAVATASGLPAFSIDDPGSVVIGGYGPSFGGAYQLDEVLLSRRLYTPGEVAALASGYRAGDGVYAATIAGRCGGNALELDAIGGRPFLGNQGYTIRMRGQVPQLCVLALGESRCLLGGVYALPLDGGLLLPELAGCTVVADPLVLVYGSVGPGAAWLAPLPISTTLPPGAALWCQAVGVDAAGGVATSNGFTFVLGS